MYPSQISWIYPLTGPINSFWCNPNVEYFKLWKFLLLAAFKMNLAIFGIVLAFVGSALAFPEKIAKIPQIAENKVKEEFQLEDRQSGK